ncbi:hypothetical protein [Salibacter halophilus]|uniref:Uncharacterized protein n=1 Tax=Salibacter halophilus TaxID=1803916 RepID=A0A6N6M7X4_9FLAO|nr:hypothetical protein [Salibacter halophilus]KAB1064347.1 hypothetical protein F3059_06495 [Salibacter halophilus]
MKTTKRFFLSIAIIVLSIPTFNSCKKGDGDPFISLRSRKARVAGEWTVDSWNKQTTFSGSDIYDGETYTSNGNSKTQINGSSITISESGTESGPTSSDSYSTNATGYITAEITFKKDGSFTRTYDYKNMTSTYTTGGNSTTTTYNQTIKETGTWNFLGGVEDEFKNKERIILNIIEVNSTYNYTDTDGYTGDGYDTESFANGESTEVWQLTTLRHKEMELEAEIGNSTSYNSTDKWGGNVYTNTGSSSENGIIEGTLKQ